MKQKSIKLNMLLNAIRGLMSIIFPLITFPYISRIFTVEDIGRFNFSVSTITYFMVIANLGINTYAIREGAKLKNNKAELKTFVDEMFSINMVSTGVAYLLLVLLMTTVSKFSNYTSILVILSLQIIFKTIGIEWIYSIFEDFAYITIRSIAFQVLSLVMMFLLVHNRNDFLIYVGIVAFATAGSNVINYVHARKYCKVRLTRKIDWKQHMKPIMVLFAMTVTTGFYTSIGTTILGFISGDYAVGIYFVSTKIYNVAKALLSSILIVTIPRLSALHGDHDITGFQAVSEDIRCTLYTVVIPAVIGMILLRKQIILLFFTSEYLSATFSFTLLSIALFFCMAAWFWGRCILIPMKMEMVVLKATIVSTLANIGLSFALIPFWEGKGAALATIVAEAINFVWCTYEARKHIEIKGLGRMIVKILIGCVGIVLCILLLQLLKLNSSVYLVCSIIASVGVYLGIEILLKNPAILDVVKKLNRVLFHKA